MAQALHTTLRFSDPRAFARRSIEAHELALAGGVPADLDERVLRAAAGISPDQDGPTHVLSGSEIGDARAGTPLCAVAADVVASVADTSAAGRHLVVLTDARGRLLWRSGSP